MSRAVIVATALLISLPAIAGPIAAQTAVQLEVEVDEYAVPWERSRPRDPFVAPDGRVWFVGQAGNYLAVFDPTTSGFERVEIDPGTHPHNQIVGDDGVVWYAGNRNGMIGRYDPVSGEIRRFPMPDSTIRDPHTLAFDGKGRIFFTVQQAGQVGRLDIATGKVDLARVGDGTRPYGIVVDGEGRPWFTQFGTNKLTSIDPESLALSDFQLPEGAKPRRIAVDRDGRTIWYVDFARGFLGRLDPSTGEVREWLSPTGQGAYPYAMAADDFGRMWYVETGPRPNRLIAFDPATEQFVVNQDIGEARANTIRHMVFDPVTRSIWYGADLNVIGRIAVPGAISPVP